MKLPRLKYHTRQNLNLIFGKITSSRGIMVILSNSEEKKSVFLKKI